MPIFRFSEPFGEQREKIESKKRELSQIQKELDAARDEAKISEHRKREKGVRQEIFKLERELRAAERRADEPEVGALPDFVVIGGKSAVPPSSTISFASTRSSIPLPPKRCTTSTAFSTRAPNGTGGAFRHPG